MGMGETALSLVGRQGENMVCVSVFPSAAQVSCMPDSCIPLSSESDVHSLHFT